MTVGEMLGRMSCLELDEWVERLQEEPLGRSREDVRFAKLGSLVAALLVKDGGKKAWAMMVDYGAAKEPRSPADLELFFKRLAQRMRGKIVRKERDKNGHNRIAPG